MEQLAQDHKGRIFLALDDLPIPQASTLLEYLTSYPDIVELLAGVKIHSFADAHGLKWAIDFIKKHGIGKVWVDYKIHEIPEQAQKRAAEIQKVGADIVTVHATGGIKMMQAVSEIGMEVFAVTVLTTHDAVEVANTYHRSISETVWFLADMALLAGVDNIVCPATFVNNLRVDDRFDRFISPNIHSLEEVREAIAHGVTNLVIGKLITQASNPMEMMEKIGQVIKSGQAA